MSFWDKVLEIYQRLDTASYYELIGVEVAAPGDVIDARYFRIVHKLHPDKHARERDPGRLQALTRIYARLGEAHKVLTAPKLREEYDAALARGEVRLSGDHDVEKMRAEPDPKTDTGRKFLKMGQALLDNGDRRKARAQLELARQFEPESKAIAAALQKLTDIEDAREKRLARFKPAPTPSAPAAAPTPAPGPAPGPAPAPASAAAPAAAEADIPIPIDTLLAELARVKAAAPDAILGIAPTAERAVGRAVAQALIDKYHPKRFTADPRARELALEIARRVKQAYTDWRELRSQLRGRTAPARALPPARPEPAAKSALAAKPAPVRPAGPTPAPIPAATEPAATKPELPFDPPPPPNSNLGRALAYMAASSWLRAANAFQSATREDPRNNKVRGLYHVARGMQAKHERRGDDARKEFKNALMYDPGNADAKRELGT